MRFNAGYSWRRLGIYIKILWRDCKLIWNIWLEHINAHWFDRYGSLDWVKARGISRRLFGLKRQLEAELHE